MVSSLMVIVDITILLDKIAKANYIQFVLPLKHIKSSKSARANNRDIYIICLSKLLFYLSIMDYHLATQILVLYLPHHQPRPCDNFHSEFQVFYVDNSILGGRIDEILLDLELAQHKGAELGLHLKHKKLENVCSNPEIISAILSIVP